MLFLHQYEAFSKNGFDAEGVADNLPSDKNLRLV